jgi:hypothetical protein
MKFKVLFIIALMSSLLTGCQMMPPPAPGMANVRVNVIAERKMGVVAPEDRVSVYDDAPAANKNGSGAFERVDYSALDEIVVWMQPNENVRGAASGIAPASVEVEAKKSAAGLSLAVSVGQHVVVHNRGSRAGVFYSVSDGNAFDLGSIPAGGQGVFTVGSTGLIEILSDASKDPVAEIYAAPSRWVSLAHSGGSVDFMNLPPGRYKIVSWHPRLPGYEAGITLSPNQIGAADIKVGVNALPKVGR